MDRIDKKLNNLKLQSNTLKIVLYIISAIAFSCIYYYFFKNEDNLKSFTIELIGINLAILSLNISTYLHLHDKFKKEINELKNTDKIDLKYKNTFILVYTKEINLLTIELLITSFSIFFCSIVSILFKLPTLISNLINIYAFVETILYLLQTVLCIKSFNFINFNKEKNN